TPDQVESEIIGCVNLVKKVLTTLGIEDYRVRVGLRDPDSTKYVGQPENWDRAEQSLRNVATTLDVPFTEAPGEAAFYGPKIDFLVKDVIGREWQLGTVQVDYNLPERFDLSYIGSDNEAHRPVMIHRAPFGSMERFVGVLIEHFAGHFPTWLAPEQVRVVPISEKYHAYAQTVLEQLRQLKGLRVTIDTASEKVGAKIRLAQLDKVPYMLLIGAQEEESKQVSIRHRNHGDLGSKELSTFLKDVESEIRERSL
ncbi:MAG: threonine--tRNA ligase, partial [Verrucomicrobiales bacterium]